MDPALQRLTPLLGALTNHEKTRPAGRVWTLDGVRSLLDAAGAVEPPSPAVQVVGSKGKGTAAHYIAAAARSAGRRVGLYTSPHQVTILERVQVQGRHIAVEVLEHGLRRILARARDLEVPVTFFEAMTLAAVECFDAEGVDFGVWEAGLGGRLDATTALPAEATVLTSVELEHTALLGDTIALVAAEKAHAMRPGGVAFTVAEGEALEVFAAHAAEHGVRLFRYGVDYGAEDLAWDGEAWTFGLRPLLGPARPVRLEGASAVEVPLAATAGAVVSWLLSRDDFTVARPPLPGRFERVTHKGKALILDGAHTPGSMGALGREIARRWPETKVDLLFASAADKRWQEGLSELLPVVDRVWVTGLDGVPFLDPEVAAAWLRQRGVTVETVADAATGLKRLRAREGSGLITGSYYLVGAVRQTLGLA